MRPNSSIQAPPPSPGRPTYQNAPTHTHASQTWPAQKQLIGCLHRDAWIVASAYISPAPLWLAQTCLSALSRHTCANTMHVHWPKGHLGLRPKGTILCIRYAHDSCIQRSKIVCSGTVCPEKHRHDKECFKSHIFPKENEVRYILVSSS